MKSSMSAFLEQLNTLIWGPWMLIFFMGTGIFLTIRLRFKPWKNLGYALKLLVLSMKPDKNARQHGDISPFESLMTALAAMMGTGNIVGVATAMVLGGPGALVWMFISALFGLSSGYAESLLAVKYREKNAKGEICGGPMYVLKNALAGTWLAPLGMILGSAFALFTLGASFGMGNMTQANSVSEALKDTFQINPAITGMILGLLTLFVLLGGIKSIGKLCGALVPFMSIFYFIGTVLVIWVNRQNVPSGIGQIFSMAFSAKAMAGGLGGSIMVSMRQAMRWGIARGVFSNEAGLGSAPIAAAAAQTDHPAKQGYISMTGTFFDTMVVCMVTGLAIAASGILGMISSDGTVLDGVALTNKVFELALGPAGRYMVTIGITLFAFATIIGWEYYGEKALEFLIKAPAARTVYRLLYCGGVFLGAVASLEAVWNFSDIMNGLMAIPNLICLLLLSGVVVRETNAFERK